jgi:hypothetical protein
VIPADVQEFELELIVAFADEIAIQDGNSDEFRLIEHAAEPAAPLETIQQNGCVLFRFARRPALHVVIFGFQNQMLVFQMIYILRHFAAVDAPNFFDLISSKFAGCDHQFLIGFYQSSNQP